MLGVSLYDQWYQQPVLLLLGAIWYNLLTLTGHLIFRFVPYRTTLPAVTNSWPLSGAEIPAV
jgi:uncharacterized membrane protein YccC